jgi:hypothetical protein
MLHVRKDRAGSTSYGYEWTADGQVVQVPDEVAADLVAIPDGGFVIVEPPADEPGEADAEDSEGGDQPPDGSANDGTTAEQDAELAEPAPAGGEFTETPAAPARKRAAKKSAAPPVAE